MLSFAALADPTRRRIVEMLARGPLSVGEIASRFTTSTSAVSQHLKVLRTAKLVRSAWPRSSASTSSTPRDSPRSSSGSMVSVRCGRSDSRRSSASGDSRRADGPERFAGSLVCWLARSAVKPVDQSTSKPPRRESPDPPSEMFPDTIVKKPDRLSRASRPDCSQVEIPPPGREPPCTRPSILRDSRI